MKTKLLILLTLAIYNYPMGKDAENKRVIVSL